MFGFQKILRKKMERKIIFSLVVYKKIKKKNHI